MTMLESELPSELVDRVAPELSPRERLVWLGRPRMDLAVRPAYFLVPVGIAVGAFALVWMCKAANFLSLTSTALSGLGFIAVALVFVTSPIWLRSLARRTIYVLTNHRVLILRPGLFHRVQSFPAAGLGQMFRRERADGSGDLVFDETTSGELPHTETRGFLAIDRVGEIEALVRKTLSIARPIDLAPQRLGHRSKDVVSEEETFLRAIDVAPADRAVRLPYAHYLDQRGDERGQFLRTQAALLNAAREGNQSTKELQRRYIELRSRIDFCWLQRTGWPYPRILSWLYGAREFITFAGRCLFGMMHSWDGCVCRYCESVSKESRRHAWVGEMCIRCHRFRQGKGGCQHELLVCECWMCGFSNHDWDWPAQDKGGYCERTTCRRCGLTREVYPRE